MKKWVFNILALGLIFGGFNIAFAQEKIEVNFFYSATCPFCAKEKAFLEKLEGEYSQIEVKKLGLFEKKNAELLQGLYQRYKVPSELRGFVPITFIEEQVFLGFDEEIGSKIEDYILALIKKISPEPPSKRPVEPREPVGPEGLPRDIVSPITPEGKTHLPIIGEIDISEFSLPALAVILGFFDGFNVCSLGALVLILGLVLAFKSRGKTLVFGGIFILTTAIVYGVFIFLWHQLFSVLSPHIKKMEIVIGVLTLAGGGYFLREFLKFRKRGPVCEYNSISQKFSQKIQGVFEKRANILVIVGAIFLFAAMITIIEFPCSAVLPVLFAGILSKAHLSTSLSLFYIGLFLFFYLLDEIIVFLVSVFTMKLWIASPKFTTFLYLIAATMLFFLGFYYLFGLV